MNSITLNLKGLYLSKEEETLLNISIEEYNDLFPKILTLPKNEFLSQLKRYFQITLVPRNVFLPRDTLNKILKIIENQIYIKEYDQIDLLIKSINNINSCIYFEGTNYIPHCNKTSKPIHKCNSKLIILNNGKYFLCLKCRLIYHNSCVLFHCDNCDQDYYSSIENENKENEEILKPATWLKYHCNAVINDYMKCPNCKNVLYLDMKSKNLKCLNCKSEFGQFNIKWTCVICKNEFQSEAKVYNPYEFKIMKMAVKETLFNSIEAKPDFLPCNDISQSEIKNYKFQHKKECNGIMYKGILNKKQIVVCSKCHMLNTYEYHQWLCPICKERFKLKDYQKRRSLSRTNHSDLNYDLNKEDEPKTPNITKKNINNNNSEGIVHSLQEELNRNNKSKSPVRKIRDFSSNRFIRVPRPDMKFSEENNKNVIHSERGRKNNNNNNIKNNEHSSDKNIKVFKISSDDISTDDSCSGINRIVGGRINRRMVSPFRKDSPKNNNEEIKRKFSNMNIGVININNYNSNNNISSIIRKIPLPMQRGKSPIRGPPSRKDSDINESPKINNSNSNNNNNNINIYRVNSSNNNININNIEDNIFRADNYNIIKQIGEGTFGKIYYVEDKNKKKYAMKKILANAQVEIDALEKEYKMLNSLSNYKLNLIDIYGMETKQLDKTTYVMYVLMDLANRDWEKEILLRSQKKLYYSEEELLKILYELTRTFAELQRHNISHRDIKPQNILIFKDNKFKISDFGEAKELMTNNRATVRQTIRGTELYMSPILFQALQNRINSRYTKHNTFKSDVFSFGLCFLFAASLTYNSLLNIREIFDSVQIQIILSKYLNRYSGKFNNLLFKMLEVDEKNRPDFVELEKIVENNQ